MDSIQKKLLRVRPPRVKITYDVHTGGAIEKRELPFIAGIFADLSGDRDSGKPEIPGDYKTRKMVDIDRDNFNEVLKQCQPRAGLSEIPNVIAGGAAKITTPIVFKSLEDFEPLNVIKNVDAMNTVYEERKLLRELQARGEVDDEAAKSLENACKKLSDAATAPDALPADVTGLIDAVTPAADKRKDKFKAAFKNRVLPLYKAPATPADAVAPAKNKGAAAVIDLAVSQIDALISRQLSLVMHDKTFKELEATWRGLFYLVSRTETSTMLKLRVFNATLTELREDMEKAVEFDQSRLFKMIYEAEYGTFGGDPYSLLVAGFEIKPDPNSISFLRKMSEVAAAAHAPFITAAAPEMFGLEKSFANLAKPRDLAKIFEKAEMIGWQQFRDSEDSRYVTLVMPRVLLRLPYGEKSNPVEGINFEEDVNGSAGAGGDATAKKAEADAAAKAAKEAKDDADKKAQDAAAAPDAEKTAKQALADTAAASAKALQATADQKAKEAADAASAAGSSTGHGKLPDNSKFLWGNAAYFLAERITNAFSIYNWTAAIRGVEGGGLVEGLPLYIYSTSDDGDGIKELFCPTEVAITDRREKEINDLGFIALCHSKGSGKAAFFGGQTSNKPKKYINDDANANAALSARLPYILAASRFAHYIKVIVRDKVGGFLTRGNVEQYLNTWIGQYILLDDNAPQDVKAGFPLRAAQVIVVDVPGSPGAYKATLFLKPHFQLEELTTSIRLVADLPA